MDRARLEKLAAAGDRSAADALWEAGVRASDARLLGLAFRALPLPRRLAVLLRATERTDWGRLLEGVGLAGDPAALDRLDQSVAHAQSNRRVRLVDAADVLATICAAQRDGWALADGGTVAKGSSGQSSVCLAVRRDDGTIAWAIGAGSARTPNPRTVQAWTEIRSWSGAKPEKNARALAKWAKAPRATWRVTDADATIAAPVAAPKPPGRLTRELASVAVLFVHELADDRDLLKAAADAPASGLAAAGEVLVAAERAPTIGIAAARRVIAGKAKPLEEAAQTVEISLKKQSDVGKIAELGALPEGWHLSLACDKPAIDPCETARPAGCTGLTLSGWHAEAVASRLFDPSWCALKRLEFAQFWAGEMDDAMASAPPPLIASAQLESFRADRKMPAWAAAAVRASRATLRAFAAEDGHVAQAIVGTVDPEQLRRLEVPATAEMLRVIAAATGLESLTTGGSESGLAVPVSLRTLHIENGARMVRTRLARLGELRRLHLGAGIDDALEVVAASAPHLRDLHLSRAARAPTDTVATPERISLFWASFDEAAWLELIASGFFDAARVVEIERGEVTTRVLRALLERLDQRSGPPLAGLRLRGVHFETETVVWMSRLRVMEGLALLDLTDSGIKKAAIAALHASGIDRRAVAGVRGWKLK